MRKTILTLISALSLSSVFGQSADELIGNAINQQHWRELRTLYSQKGEEVSNPILSTLSQFLINHFYNRPDSANYYGAELLNKHSASLGSLVGSTIAFMAYNFERVNDLEKAQGILKQYNEALKAAGQPADPTILAYENQYRALNEKGGFSVTRPQKDINIPISFLDTKEKPGLVFVDTQINGQTYRTIYDTGAGENIISKEIAEKLGLKIYSFEGPVVAGVGGVQSTAFTIVDSLQLGEITYKNVPFQVIDFRTGNKEADIKMKEIGFNCILGVQSMLPLGEIQFDFEKKVMTIPEQLSKSPNSAPNIFFTQSKTIGINVWDKRTGQTLYGLLDTGGSISTLTFKYYNEHPTQFEGVTPTDSVRIAGVGGTQTLKTISTLWEYSLDNKQFIKEPIIVYATDNGKEESGLDLLFGLPSLTRHNKVTINFKDMWIQFSE